MMFFLKQFVSFWLKKFINSTEPDEPPKKFPRLSHNALVEYTPFRMQPFVPTILAISNSSSSIGKYIEIFLQLLDQQEIQIFLERDQCFQLADKYLIATAFTYFIRADFCPCQFTPYNFFVALHLAHDMEEDNEELKINLFTTAFGSNCNGNQYRHFLSSRDELWKSIDHRGVVSSNCCQKVMSLRPLHPVWQRNRAEVHAGANGQFSHGVCSNCCKVKSIIELDDENDNTASNWQITNRETLQEPNRMENVSLQPSRLYSRTLHQYVQHTNVMKITYFDKTSL